MELSSMYEKATLADLAIVTGILLALCSFILAPFRSMDFFLIIGVGIGLVAVGFILDRIYERRRAMVDLERMRPKLAAYVEDAERLMVSGGKALEAGKSKKALNIYLSAHTTLELAEQVAEDMQDVHRKDVIARDLTQVRSGMGQAKVGMAADISNRAEQLYRNGKYRKALDLCEESSTLLADASRFLDVSGEVRKNEESMLNCRKRLGELEMNALMKEVSERDGYFREYFDKGLLFDAREMLNIMEVKVQKASGIAEEFDFSTAMGEINHSLVTVREGKNTVEKAILERLKTRDAGGKGITAIIDKVDPSLKKVAVDANDEIEVYSGYDFRNGAVRLQFVVNNTRGSVIGRVMLKGLRDERLLNLIRVVPDYEVHFNEVTLGNIQPGEKKTVNFFFDPRVCGEMIIDSTLTYLEASGDYRTIIPERKVIDIPEPKVGRGEDVNSSYLNALMEQARSVGVRAFHVPADLHPARAIAIVEGVVEEMGLSPVWHGSNPPAAGYYGICDDLECGLIVTSREKMVEIRAGGAGKETITYLLTSVSRDLRDRFEKEGHRGVNVNLTIQDSIIYKSSIPLGSKNIPIVVEEDKGGVPGEGDEDAWTDDGIHLEDGSGDMADVRDLKNGDVTVIEPEGRAPAKRKRKDPAPHV
jgi:hypothetical protein